MRCLHFYASALSSGSSLFEHDVRNLGQVKMLNVLRSSTTLAGV